uniref:Ciliary microtubule inner protein 7 n=1 Tax=Podarcis muralis TaxID=64176 RepID=A0A670K6Q1_PODMU
VAKSLVGSWPHANGFYGNYRSRCRSDFTQEYRKAAQPQPPELFLKRMKETPSKHIFSKHDNSAGVNCLVIVSWQGLGRRRIEGSLPNTKNLIDWVPLKEELRRERPLISSYQYDFHSREKVPQVLVHHSHRQGQPLQRTPSTTYQHTYRSRGGGLDAEEVTGFSEQGEPVTGSSLDSEAEAEAGRARAPLPACLQGHTGQCTGLNRDCRWAATV